MVAKQKIVPGDVLVVEPAFSTSLFREFYSTHCLHCFETIKEKPVCCPGCPTVGHNLIGKLTESNNGFQDRVFDL